MTVREVREMLLVVFLLLLTDQTTAEYRRLGLASLCRRFRSSWAGVYSLSVISLNSPQEAVIVSLGQAEITGPLSCDLHIRSSAPGQTKLAPAMTSSAAQLKSDYS